MANLLNMSGGSLLKKDATYLPDYTLIFHWEASDGIVNGGWVDRIQGKVLAAYGNPQLVDGVFKVRGGTVETYFGAELNSNIPVNMGDIWQVDVEFIVDSVPTDNKALCTTDFGSLTLANHAFSLGVGPQSTLSCNPKFTGNKSGPLYNVKMPFTTYGELSKASIGMEKVNDTTYQPYYILNGVRYDSPNTTTVEGATFNGNFNQTTLYVGRGSSPNTGNYSQDWQYIKSLKIYKKEQL